MQCKDNHLISLIHIMHDCIFVQREVRSLCNIYQHSTINNRHGDLNALMNLRLSRSAGSSEGDGSCAVTKSTNTDDGQRLARHEAATANRRWPISVNVATGQPNTMHFPCIMLAVSGAVPLN